MRIRRPRSEHLPLVDYGREFVSLSVKELGVVDQARAFGEDLVQAWASDDPATALAALYSPDGIREDAFAGMVSASADSLAWLSQRLATYEAVTLSIEDLYASGLGPAAIYTITMTDTDFECQMRLGSVWNLDEDGVITHEYVYYDHSTLHSCSWWD